MHLFCFKLADKRLQRSFGKPKKPNIILLRRYYFSLQDEIHRWMKDNNVEYDFTFILMEVNITIKDDNKAMLFKLTWG